MRRRAKAAKAKVEAKRPLARKSRGNDGSSRRELEKRLAEALEQQAATSEILGVIRRSPMDAQPVFDVIIRNAVRLCDGLFGCLFRFDGERLMVFWPHRRGSSVLFLHALRRLIRLVSGAEPKFHPDEISLPGSRAEAVELLRDTGFVLRDYSFGVRDLFVQCIIVAEKVEKGAPAAVSFVSELTATA